MLDTPASGAMTQAASALAEVLASPDSAGPAQATPSPALASQDLAVPKLSGFLHYSHFDTSNLG